MLQFRRQPWRNVLRLVAAVANGVLVGCATNQAPVDQVKYFSQAFAAVNVVGQPLLDDLAANERQQGRDQAVLRAQKRPPGKCIETDTDAPTWSVAGTARGQGFIDGFCLRDAGYFAESGDPPATAQLRGALHVIESYADVLSALAEGRNLDQALGQIDALGQEVSGLLSLVGANVAVQAALTALNPIVKNAAQKANAEECKRLIIDGSPEVTQLIAALRAAIPPMFSTLISQPRVTLSKDGLAATQITENLGRIEQERAVVSQYVMLLDKLQLAWSLTVAAANKPGGSRLPDLVAKTAELRADADAVRKALSALRTGGQASK